MKKSLIIATFLVFGFTFSQNITPKYEVVNNKVKATYFYENGQIKQEGFYLNGKLHGKWTSYNEDGTKQSIGEYNNGVKTGKWFFWNNSLLSEVDYANNKVVAVNNWSNTRLAKN